MRTPLSARPEGGKLGRRARKISSQVSREIGECGERCALEGLRPGEGEEFKEPGKAVDHIHRVLERELPRTV